MGRAIAALDETFTTHRAPISHKHIHTSYCTHLKALEAGGVVGRGVAALAKKVHERGGGSLGMAQEDEAALMEVRTSRASNAGAGQLIRKKGEAQGRLERRTSSFPCPFTRLFAPSYVP